MKTIFKALFFVTVLISTCKASAQTDYVITIKGDSIACKISTSLFGVFKYKSAAMTKSGDIEPDLIKEYYIAEKKTLNRVVFESTSKMPVYMTVLEKGKISLYAMIYFTYTDPALGIPVRIKETDWYLSKGSDNVSAVETNRRFISIAGQRRKAGFAEMLSDNKNVYDKFIADGKFSDDEIRNIIHLYNTGLPMKSYANYVITKNNDTILCEIEPATINTPPKYKANPKDRFTKIDPATITEYFLTEDSATYLLKTLPKEKYPQYVKRLLTGRINLYAYSLNNASKDKDALLFACKEPGDLVQVKHAYNRINKNDNKALADLISDEPGLSDRFKNLPSDFITILNCVKDYNKEPQNSNKSAK